MSQRSNPFQSTFAAILPTHPLTHHESKLQSGRINRLSKNIRYSGVKNFGQLRQPSICSRQKAAKNKRPRPRRRSLCFFSLGSLLGATKKGKEGIADVHIRDIHTRYIGKKKGAERVCCSNSWGKCDEERRRKLSVGKARKLFIKKKVPTICDIGYKGYGDVRPDRGDHI